MKVPRKRGQLFLRLVLSNDELHLVVYRMDLIKRR